MMSPVDSHASRWFRFLSRWALVTTLVVVALFASFFVVLGAAGSAPSDYAELAGAAHQPDAYRAVGVLDFLVWFGLGGTLVGLACVLAQQAPIRAAFIAACGVGQVVGALGGFIRLNAVSDLATRYAGAAPDQQAEVVRSYLDLWLVIGAHFDAGSTLYGAGFLLVASAALSVVGFPRWLAGWFALSGIWPLVSNTLSFVGSPLQLTNLFPLYMVLGIAGLHLAIAVAFWRRAPALVPSLKASGVG